MLKVVAFLISLLIIIFVFTLLVKKKEAANEVKGVPIDAVITYVDSDDPSWQKEYQIYSQGSGSVEILTVNADNPWRWKSNNEAKYCIMAIRKYAPFISRIFLLMSSESQTPSWLKELGDKNVIPVYHRDIYENPSDLPTWNSTSIESNLHRIPGLSEYFIYFNDDCFIGNHVNISDFIYSDKNGQIKLKIGTEKNKVSPRGTAVSNELGYASAWKNVNKMLDILFPNTKNDNRLLTRHMPLIQRKSDHIFLRNYFQKEFDRVSKSKFRNTSIFNTTGGLAEYYSIYNGTGSAGTVGNSSKNYQQYFLSNDRERNRKIYGSLLKSRPHFFNLQNTITEKEPEKNRILSQDLQHFLEKYY